MSGVFLNNSLVCVLRQDFSLNLKLTDPATLVSQLSLGSLVPDSQTLGL